MYADFVKDVSIHAKDLQAYGDALKPLGNAAINAVKSAQSLTVTAIPDIKPPITHRKPTVAYYWRVLKWIVAHRDETNCRQKWRRMDREVQK